MTVEDMNIERRRLEQEIEKLLSESPLSKQNGILITDCHIHTLIHTGENKILASLSVKLNESRFK